MLQLWNEMADWDLICAALSEIVHEATQTDATSPGSLWYECNDPSMEDELNDMLGVIGVEDILPSQVWHVAGLGNSFEKIDYEPGDGVRGLSFVHPFDVRRYWLERNRQCIGFRWNNHNPRHDDVFVQPDNKSEIQRVQMSTGQNVEHLWYPWDFMHMRRTFRLRSSEHGEPIFEEAQGIYKKLRMAVDMMVVHRAQIQPDRYVVNIDVKDQAPMEQMKTVARWKQSLRSKLAFGPGQSASAMTDPSSFDSFHNAMALDTILWMAKPNGFQHTVEKLPGTASVPDVYDIELLTDLFYSIIGMPKAWFGVTKDGQNPPSGKSLLAQDMRFLRKIKSIRRPVINEYTRLGYFHALLKNKDVSKLEIRAKMSPIGSLEDQMKLELLAAQADVLDKLGDLMEKYSLPREAWVEVIFKRYMHLPDDVVNVFLTALPPEAEAQEESKRKPAPAIGKILAECAQYATGNRDALMRMRQLQEAVYGGPGNSMAEKREARRMKETLTKMPEFKKDELVVSSFGTNPLTQLAGTPPVAKSSQSINESASAEPAWRKWSPLK